MFSLIFRNFARKSLNSIPKQAPKPSLKKEQPFPEDFKKLGLRKKDINPEVTDIYNRLKSKGADNLVDKIIDQKIKDGQEDEFFSDIFQTDMGEERKMQDPEPRYNAQNNEKLMSFEEMEKFNQNFPAELKEKAENLLEQEILENKIMENFKKAVNEDVDKATDRVDDRRELGKYEEFDDPFPLDEKENPSYWDEMIADLDPAFKKHYAQIALNDKKKLVKQLQSLDKIQQKRKIRDLYKKFKIETRDPNAPREVDIYIETAKNNVRKWLEEIFKADKRVIYGDILKDGFIEILKIDLNPSMSVCTIFFDMFFPYLPNNIDNPKRKETLENVRRKLIHASPYLRSKLTNCVGLKYAPELRWIPWQVGADPSQVLKGVPSDDTITNNLFTAKGEELKLIIEPKLPGKYSKRNAKKRLKKEQDAEKNIYQIKKEKKEEREAKEEEAKKHPKPWWIVKRDKEKKNIKYK